MNSVTSSTLGLAQSPITNAPRDAARHIFVVGNSRSGTTMMAQILGRNVRVHMLNELHFIEGIVSPAAFASHDPVLPQTAIDLAARILCIDANGYYNQADLHCFRSRAQAILDAAGTGQPPLTHAELFAKVIRAASYDAGKIIACEQTPHNVFYIPQILTLISGAVVINMVRDPRDVLLSQKNKWKLRRNGYRNVPLRETMRALFNYHPYITARMWRAAIFAGLQVQDARILTLKYEDVLCDPKASVQRVCAHCGIDYSPDMLEIRFQGSSSDHQAARNYDKVQIGINKSRADAWRQGGLSPAEITICQRVTAPAMACLGYDLVPAPRCGLLREIWVWSYLPIMITGALMLNLNKIKALGGLAKRRFSSRTLSRAETITE